MERSYWTPMHLQILLHYHCTPVQFEPDTDTALTYTNELINAKLLTDTKPLTTTEKGKAHVVMLCNLPLPEQRYVDTDGKVIEL